MFDRDCIPNAESHGMDFGCLTSASFALIVQWKSTYFCVDALSFVHTYTLHLGVSFWFELPAVANANYIIIVRSIIHTGILFYGFCVPKSKSLFKYCFEHFRCKCGLVLFYFFTKFSYFLLSCACLFRPPNQCAKCNYEFCACVEWCVYCIMYIYIRECAYFCLFYPLLFLKHNITKHNKTKTKFKPKRTKRKFSSVECDWGIRVRLYKCFAADRMKSDVWVWYYFVCATHICMCG